ncbi:MAG: hypothetical protein L3J70_03030 [Gammaproteobacteria bacterium]|nr:hypothetical protein [Gammaproteobacteria bacterium]
MKLVFGIKIVSLLVLLFALSGCSDGGGGGDNGGGSESGSNWDQMKWDQGKWG